MTKTSVPAYELTLFVNGASDLSAGAVQNATELCDLHLEGAYQLSIVDLLDDPAAALKSGVIAAPALVVTRPLPIRRHIGDLSNPNRVLRALGLMASKDV